MKLVKTASGKKSIKISKKEWQSIGKTAGWEEGSNLSDGNLMELENLEEKAHDLIELGNKLNNLKASLIKGNTSAPSLTERLVKLNQLVDDSILDIEFDIKRLITPSYSI